MITEFIITYCGCITSKESTKAKSERIGFLVGEKINGCSMM